MKRHGFGGVGQSTHGQDDRAHKLDLSICSYPAKVFKGYAHGRPDGRRQGYYQNLKVLKVIPEHNLLLV